MSSVFDLQESKGRPSPFDLPTSKGKKSSPFDLGKSAGKSSPFDLNTKSTQEDAIVQQADAQGLGSSIWEGVKGAGRTAVDLISRPNYAVAGAAEELFAPQGGGIGAVPGRVASEIFSGLPGVQGQKEGFGQVLEQAGVGEMGKLSDVLGFMYNDTGEGAALQRGGWADPSTRGTVGLAADIFTDPTTYLTLGGNKLGRVITGKGERFLSKEGKAALSGIEDSLAPARQLALEGAGDNHVLRVVARKQINEQKYKLLEEEIAKNPKLLDKTGLKIGRTKWTEGMEIIPRSALDKLSATAGKVVRASPGGELAARGAEKLSDGWHRMWDAYADLRGLPKEVQAGAKAVLRENASAAAMHKEMMFSRYREIEDVSDELAKKYGKGAVGKKALGKKFAEWRQGTGTPNISPQELEMFKSRAALYDEGGLLALREGTITPEQWQEYQGKYLHQQYENPEVLSETLKASGRTPGVATTERYTKGREFKDYAEAERVAKNLHEEGMRNRRAGGKAPVYGELKPEYDAGKNQAAWIQQLTDDVWRKRTVEEFRDRFGLALDDTFDPGKVYDVTSKMSLKPHERAAIDSFIDGSRDISDLEKSFEVGWRNANTAELRRATKNMHRAVQAVPRKASETLTIRPDEIAHYRRKGWDVFSDSSDDVPAKAFVEQQKAIARLPDAQREYQGLLRDAPLDYAEGRTLRNADEIPYYQREGWTVLDQDGAEVTEKLAETSAVAAEKLRQAKIELERAKKAAPGAWQESDAVNAIQNQIYSLEKDAVARREKLQAFRLNSVSGAKQQAWRDKVARAKAEVDDLKASVDAVPSRLTAYRVKGGGPKEQIQYLSGLRSAQRDLQGALHRSVRDVVNLGPDGKPVNGWDEASKELKKVLPKLSPEAQKDLGRELTSMARSPGQILRIREALGEHNMPALNVVNAGDINPYYEKYGLPGQLATVSGGIWGDKEVHIPRIIAEMVGNAPRDIVMDAATRAKLGPMVKAYDWYSNAFKMATYPFYPAGAARDVYNNVMQAFLGVGVGSLMRPGQALRVLRGDAKDAIRLAGRDYSAAELKTMAKDLGVIDPSARSFIQFTGEKGAEKPGFLSRARMVRGSLDNGTRTQLFINSIAQGASPETAAQIVKDFLYDYSELSVFDRDVMRRAIPFWVYPRKTIGSTAHVLATEPGRLANLAKPFRGREDENQAMTSWEGEGFKMRLERDGNTVTMVNGVDLPIRSLDILWKGSPQKTMQGWLSMAAPALKVPYEVVSGQDPFRGKEFGRTQAYALKPVMDRMPKSIQSWAGYSEERDAAGRPVFKYRADRIQVLSEAMLVSRILSTSDRAFREQARDPNISARLLDFMTGLRFKSLDLDAETQMRAKERERLLREEAVKQGIAKEGTYLFRTKTKP